MMIGNELNQTSVDALLGDISSDFIPEWDAFAEATKYINIFACKEVIYDEASEKLTIVE